MQRELCRWPGKDSRLAAIFFQGLRAFWPSRRHPGRGPRVLALPRYTGDMQNAADQSRSRVIPANEYRRERWRNQLGWTREIIRSPQDDNWDWRVSIAEIERDAAFSSFPGIERELVLLAGDGLRLRFDDGEIRELLPPHGKARFAGERSVTGELVGGPTHDFNLMWRRDRVQAELWHRPLVGPMVVFAEPDSTWVVHLMAGQARFADDSGLLPMEAGDTAVIEAGSHRLRHVLEGGGELLVIRIRPASPAGAG